MNKNNPKTAVWEYLKENNEFEIDKNIESKLILTGLDIPRKVDHLFRSKLGHQN